MLRPKAGHLKGTAAATERNIIIDIIDVCVCVCVVCACDVALLGHHVIVTTGAATTEHAQ
jgi:hypothetical protein